MKLIILACTVAVVGVGPTFKVMLLRYCISQQFSFFLYVISHHEKSGH